MTCLLVLRYRDFLRKIKESLYFLRYMFITKNNENNE